MDYSSNSHHPKSNLHFIILPLMAQGHVIPLLDLARLLAARPGVLVTIIAPTLSASRLKPAVDRAAQSGLPLRLVHVDFPAREAGLPDGTETVDALTSPDMVKSYFAASQLLQHPVENLLLNQIRPSPSCIISDSWFSWMRETAGKLRVPRLVFQGFGCFAWCCVHTIRSHNLHQTIVSDTDPFFVPGLPHQIEITKAQVPAAFTHSPDMEEIYNDMLESEPAADGMVVNSFEELEPEHYAKSYAATRGRSGGWDQCLCSIRTCLIRWIEAMRLPLLSGSAPGRQIGGLHLFRHYLQVHGRGRGRWAGREGEAWVPQILILSHLAMTSFVMHCGRVEFKARRHLQLLS